MRRVQRPFFSATGVGGSAIALDAAGNIYVAGTTQRLDYPTTPGAYQPTFPAFIACTGFLCQVGGQGLNQYVSKINPTGSALIYSTALTGAGTGTSNTGLAVDSTGNAYVTGFAGTGYPYTVTAPTVRRGPIGSTAVFAGLPFLSKLDALGKSLLYSVPVGGSGVQVDAAGKVYVGGSVGYTLSGSTYSVDGSILPALSGVPSQCLPNGLISTNAAYVAQADGSTGNVLGMQFVGGSTLVLSSAALSGPEIWVAGLTGDANIPYTPNALIPSYVSPTLKSGAYLGAVDFSQPQPPAGTPQIACIVDSANLAPAGPMERYQLMTILGSNLGPANGLASDSSTTSLGGGQATFDGMAAPLLYVSSTQINLAVPLIPSPQQSTALQISLGGVTSQKRGVPLVSANPSLFLNVPMSSLSVSNSPGYVALTLNADGSLNSASNPARLGSTISVFLNGLAPEPGVVTGAAQVSAEGFTVVRMSALTPYVQKVDLQLPSALTTNYSFSCSSGPTGLCSVGFSLYYGIGSGLSLLPVGSGREGRGWAWVSP